MLANQLTLRDAFFIRLVMFSVLLPAAAGLLFGQERAEERDRSAERAESAGPEEASAEEAMPLQLPSP